jgi:hypothetical protein
LLRKPVEIIVGITRAISALLAGRQPNLPMMNESPRTRAYHLVHAADGIPAAVVA